MEKQVKLNITAFLIKSDISQKDVLAIRGRKQRSIIQIEGTECEFYWRSNPSKPRWVELFSGVEGLNTNSMQGKSLQGILIFQCEGRVFCFTFGHARHLINPLTIERYFGLKVALSLSDPALIKSIDKANIDKTPFRSRTQSSKYVSLSEFEFKFDWEILKSLTGIVETQSEKSYETITGADSVSISTEISLKEIPKTAIRLLTAYKSKVYRSKYPWIDYIVPLRDKALVDSLDSLAVKSINDEDIDEIWISPPAIVPYENFSGFCYKRRGSTTASEVTHPDMDLESCLSEKKLSKKVTLSNIKSTKIYLYDGSDREIEAWPLYSCLNVELEKDGHRYLLSEGDWYRVDRDFVKEVDEYFDAFPRSPLVFEDYKGKLEGPYLNDIADGKKFFMMDQKFVKLSGATSKFEFCDLLTPDNEIIHVKKYSSSSVLSHLFSQAYVSAESLLRSTEVAEQVNTHLAKEYDHLFEFDAKKQPRAVTIVLAIMQKRAGALHMPFFSKVNFKQYSQRLLDMGYEVQLKKINC